MPATYQNDIPQPTDAFSKSQGDILNNFSALESFMTVNHYDPNDPNYGKHLQLNFPASVATIPSTATGELCIYPNTGLASTPALWILQQGSTSPAPGTDFTTVVNPGSSTAYTYLPSRTLLSWGTASASSSGTPVTLPVAYANTKYSVQITTQNPSLTAAATITDTSHFKITTTSGSPTVFWFAIGLGA